MRTMLLPILTLVALSGTAADGPQPMSAVDLLGITIQSELQLSPDGTQVLFVRSSADWEEDCRVSHIWKVAADGSGLLQMTNGKHGESTPRWSPDGTRIAFVAKRDGETEQVYLQATAGGEAIQLSKHETSVSDIAWSPDGASIYFLATEAKSKEEKERDKRIGEVYSFDRNFKHKHLWAIDIEAKAERRVTEGDFSVIAYSIADDGKTLVYHAAPSPLFDDEDESEVWIRQLDDGSSAHRLTDNSVAESDGLLSPDGSTVLFMAGANRDFETYYQGKLFLVPASGGEARLLMPDLPCDILEATWAGETILFRAVVGVRVELLALEPDSDTPTRITESDHTIRSWHLPPGSSTIAWISQSTDSPGDLWIAGLERSEPRRITGFAEAVREEYRFPRTEAVSWQGRDGVTVEGLLTYPLDFEEGTRYPLVVTVHGGPAAASTFRFPSWAGYLPVLAAQGFAVLDPNYRGSTGYGDDFMRDMVGHYFNEADHDVLTGVDAMIERGIADPERLVIMGWSAGGHMTNWLVTQTDRFAAAASGAGASNWISMYGQSDVRSYRTPWFLGSPWQEEAPIERFLENSPISYVPRATTPTLILVGENDVRVPMPQSVEMFRALRANNVETELLVFPDQPHGLLRLKHQLHKINAELAWFHRHALGKEYEMELPPESKKENGEKESS